MTSTDPDAHTLDVDAAIARGKDQWNTGTSATASEQAFLDRTTLADEVVLLRTELAHTQDALAEADQEIRYLTHENSA